VASAAAPAAISAAELRKITDQTLFLVDCLGTIEKYVDSIDTNPDADDYEGNLETEMWLVTNMVRSVYDDLERLVGQMHRRCEAAGGAA